MRFLEFVPRLRCATLGMTKMLVTYLCDQLKFNAGVVR
jgi:hypothetical protein